MKFKSSSQRKAVMAKLNAIRTIPGPNLPTNKLPVQVGIIVPSTELDKQITDQEFNKRIDSEKRFFDKKFGGDTSHKTVGSYILGKQLIKEKGEFIQSSMTRADYIKHKISMEKHFIKRRKQWKQDSLLIRIEGQDFIVPKRKFIPTDKGQSKQIIIS